MATRVLVAKPGLDGHDRGAKIVARTLRDAGFEVIYTGIRQRIEDIVSIALQEDVALVGLSILSGAHVALTTRTVDALRAADAGDIAVVVGGTIPQADVPKLLEAGAAAVFPTGTPLDVLVQEVRKLTSERVDSDAPWRDDRGRARRHGPQGQEAARGHRVGGGRRFRHRVDAPGAQRLRLPDHGRADGRSHVAHRTRHGRRAAAGAASDRAGAPGAVGPRRHRRTIGAGLGPSHHWIVRDMLGIPYEKPAAYTRDYLEVLNTALAGPGEVDVENDSFTVHNPTVLGAESPMPVLVAALGPVMLQIAGELADGTVLWMADERAIGDHIAPRITKAADNAGRPAPRIVAGIPVCLCANSEIDAAKARANRILAEAETSPNYQKLLDCGDARDVGDLCAAGDEEAILARFKKFADAGVTDLSVRLLPIGETRDELIASKYRTREVFRSWPRAVR